MPRMIDPRADAAILRRWAWLLTAITIGWNALEAVVAIGNGLQAGSIALIGFVWTRWSKSVAPW